MSPLAAVVVIASLIAVAAILGVIIRLLATRVRELTEETAFDLAGLGTTVQPGAVGTIVQFSTAYCARCPGTARLLEGLAAERPGLAFAHVDVTERPDLVSAHHLTQTPTVLLLDRGRVARTRLSGELSRATVSGELDALIGRSQ